MTELYVLALSVSYTHLSVPDMRLRKRVQHTEYQWVNSVSYTHLILDVSGTTGMTELYVLALLLLTTITGRTPP